MRGEYTLAYHYFGLNDSRNHLELFLDVDGNSPLETWRHFPKRTGAKAERRYRFWRAEPHRRVYLHYSGPVTGHRGRLRVMKRGVVIDKRQKPDAASILVTL